MIGKGSHDPVTPLRRPLPVTEGVSNYAEIARHLLLYALMASPDEVRLDPAVLGPEVVALQQSNQSDLAEMTASANVHRWPTLYLCHELGSVSSQKEDSNPRDAIVERYIRIFNPRQREDFFSPRVPVTRQIRFLLRAWRHEHSKRAAQRRWRNVRDDPRPRGHYAEE